MNKPRFKSLEEFSRDFGHLLLRNQRAKEGASCEENDLNAQGFARYLRAARLNSDLTPPELAAKADVPEEVVYAVEQGLIYSINDVHLQRLALTLDEEIETFELILGREISTAESPAVNGWQIIKPVSALGFGFAFMFVVLLAIFSVGHSQDYHYLVSGTGHSISGGTSPMPNREELKPIKATPLRSTHSDENQTTSRGEQTNYYWSYINANLATLKLTNEKSKVTAKPVIYGAMILTLLLLLLWLIIKNGHLPTNLTFETTTWPKRMLLYSMSLLLLCLFVVIRHTESSSIFYFVQTVYESTSSKLNDNNLESNVKGVLTGQLTPEAQAEAEAEAQAVAEAQAAAAQATAQAQATIQAQAAQATEGYQVTVVIEFKQEEHPASIVLSNFNSKREEANYMHLLKVFAVILIIMLARLQFICSKNLFKYKQFIDMKKERAL